MTASRVEMLPRHVARGAPATIGLTALCFLVTCATSVLVALANQPYFQFVNGIFDARETVARGMLFSSWLVIVGGSFTIWRPRAFGFRVGDTRRHWRLVAGTVIAGAATTALLLAVSGATPYSDASLFIETVVVPFTEELVFRGVVLTLLLLVLGQLHGAWTVVILAVLFNGVAFGLAHLANATSLAASFVLAQATFAAVLGSACAYLMAKTRSIYPAMLLHAVVNGVVVVTS